MNDKGVCRAPLASPGSAKKVLINLTLGQTSQVCSTQCARYTITLHTEHCTLHIAHCTLHAAHCTLNTAYCTLYTAH